MEIHDSTSPRGQSLNVQLRVASTQLEAGRVGQSKDFKSLHEGTLCVRQQKSAEVHQPSNLRDPNKKKEARDKWTACVVARFNAQIQEHYSGADVEDVAFRIHKDFDTGAACAESPRYTVLELLHHVYFRSKVDFCTLLRCGLSVDSLLKVALRRLAGIDPLSMHALDLDQRSDGRREAADLTCILDAAKRSGRQLELLSAFDPTDLMRAVLAADRVHFQCVPLRLLQRRPGDILPALRMLSDTLFHGGICVCRLAQQAKTNFEAICADPQIHIAPSKHHPEPLKLWCRERLNPDRFNKRLEHWCTWERNQCLLSLRTLEGGLGLPGAAATLITYFVMGLPGCTEWTNKESTISVCRVPQIDQIAIKDEHQARASLCHD
eukprot:TRINITY_DN23719_c0_g1_i1.p1 TRINITY_DN23719_c0_g1~~TRINITY_DN23719_c0_g1_i1.p1  ORF type:complete len:399 (-),score=33.74 TRINITY_DN23719_c0_g1_i1:293-1429(-)